MSADKRVTRACLNCGAAFLTRLSPSREARGKYCGRRCAGLATSPTHRQTGNRTYTSWAMMLNRCRNPNAPNFERYGGRGIMVAEEWKSFERFFADMGERPEGTTLDRKDNDGPYCAGNCRWTTSKAQQRNRRNNVLITFEGATMCQEDWAARLGMNPNTLAYRLAHWPLQRALTPIRQTAAAT